MTAPAPAPMRRPHVSIVIPTIHATSRLAPVIDGLREDDFDVPYEIIAVVDGHVELADGLPQADGRCVARTVAATGRRLGVARARNVGAAIAQGAIIAFLDDDTVPCRGWMNQLLGALDAASVKAVVGLVDSPPVRTAVDRLRDVGYKGRHVTNQDGGEAGAAVRGQLGPRPDLQGRHLVDYLSGGNCAVVRAALMDVGGFDERLLVGQDRELGRRLTAAGHPVAYVPSMRVMHFNEGTLTKLSKGRFRSGYFNFIAGEHRNAWKISRQLGIGWADLWRVHGPAIFFTAIVSNCAYSSGRLRARLTGAFGRDPMKRTHDESAGRPLPFTSVRAERPGVPGDFFDVTRTLDSRHAPQFLRRLHADPR